MCSFFSHHSVVSSGHFKISQWQRGFIMVPNFKNQISHDLEKLFYHNWKFHPICLSWESLSLVLHSVKSNWYDTFFPSCHSCILHFLLDFKEIPRYLLYSCILNNNSLAANHIILFAAISSGSHNTLTQNSLQSIRTSIFTCKKINWFQSLCTLCTN